MKKRILAIILTVVFFGTTAFVCYQQNVKSEASEHPRIVSAIKELEGAIDYLEKAPNDFGGYKAQAIADSKKAVVSLRHALQYRAKTDNKKK
jgi:hypothetical protein